MDSLFVQLCVFVTVGVNAFCVSGLRRQAKATGLARPCLSFKQTSTHTSALTCANFHTDSPTHRTHTQGSEERRMQVN